MSCWTYGNCLQRIIDSSPVNHIICSTNSELRELVAFSPVPEACELRRLHAKMLTRITRHLSDVLSVSTSAPLPPQAASTPAPSASPAASPAAPISTDLPNEQCRLGSFCLLAVNTGGRASARACLPAAICSQWRSSRSRLRLRLARLVVAAAKRAEGVVLPSSSTIGNGRNTDERRRSRSASDKDRRTNETKPSSNVYLRLHHKKKILVFCLCLLTDYTNKEDLSFI